MARRDDIWSQMWKLSPGENLWNNYSDPFGYNDVSSSLNDIFGGYEDKINRNSAEGIAKATGDSAARMASRGITGGSVVEDTASGIASNINKEKFNALSDLGIGKASSMMDLKKFFDQLGFSKNAARQGQENTRFGQARDKAGLMGNFLSDWESMDLQRDAQPGFLADFMSGISDFAGMIPGIGKGLKLLKGLGGKATAGDG